MESASSPTARALVALELIGARPGLTAEELADRLGVSERAARRYVAILREAGIPIDSTRGRYGGYRAGRGLRLPPLMFTSAEALGLLMAVLDGHHDPADPADPVGSAMGKIVRALPRELAAQVDAVRRTAAPAPDRAAARPDVTVTTALVRASADRRRVRIGYLSGAGSAWTVDVDPWAVVVRHGRWYLVCWSHGSDAVRTYRVDRVGSVDVLPETFTPPDPLEPVTLLETHLAVGWEYEAEILVDDDLDAVAGYLPRSLGRLEPADGGRTRLVGTTSNPYWYAEQLAVLPRPFRVVGGPELRHTVRRLGERLLASTADPADPPDPPDPPDPGEGHGHGDHGRLVVPHPAPEEAPMPATPAAPAAPHVTVLGLGALGRAMAVRLDSEGFPVAAWNRSAERAAATVAERPGITVHEQIADAVRGADVVLTVVRDEAAVTEVATETLPHLAPRAVWVQASTVGPAAARRLAARAAEAGVAYLDAPVSGSTAPARAGRLVWLVSGDDDAARRARPVLDALGTVKVVGTGGQEASAVKLVVNAWMASAVAAASDATALADHLGVDHATLRDVLGAGALAMPYALQKMEAMDAAQFEPGFAVNLALKDLRLAATDGDYASPLLAEVTRQFAAADAAGLGDLDVAALHRLAAGRGADDDAADGPA